MVVKAGRTPQRLAAQAAWLAYLCKHQLVESLGWRPADMEYGGWGFAQRPPRKPQAGAFRGPWDWSNLTATLYALGALRSARVPPQDPVYQQALIFVHRCQNYSESAGGSLDGGFFFSSVAPMHNKAGISRDATGRQIINSYGSMTCDGLRALLACGLPLSHPRVAAARNWISRNFTVEHNPGHFAPTSEDLRDATYYYYCWSLSHALMHLNQRRIQTPGGEVDWPVALAQELMKRQRTDGSWTNGFTDGKEDDPLVATPFAASALAICRHVVYTKGKLVVESGVDAYYLLVSSKRDEEWQ